MLTVKVEVHAEDVLAGLDTQLATMNTDIQRISLAAAESEVLPRTKALAIPTRLSGTMTVTTTGAGLAIDTTASGQNAAIMTLLNRGGTVDTIIRPHAAKALALPGGIIRAAVKGPRHYRGRRFVEKSIQQRLTPFSQRIERDLARVIAGHIGGTATG